MNAPENPQRPVTSRAHPHIYVMLVGLTAWFVLAVWSFAGAGFIDYLLFIVSSFFAAAIGLPLILFRVGVTNTGSGRDKRRPSLLDWATWDYDTWTGRLSGAQAAAQILLPVAAAAIGMTVIGVVFHFAT